MNDKPLDMEERKMLIHAIELSAHASMSISALVSALGAEHAANDRLLTILEMQEAIVRDLCATLGLSPQDHR